MAVLPFGSTAIILLLDLLLKIFKQQISSVEEIEKTAFLEYREMTQNRPNILGA